MLGCGILGKIISSIADGYGLYRLHRMYSKNDQFKYMEEEVHALNSDFSKFYKKPALTIISYAKGKNAESYETGNLKFISEVENGYSNREAIFHYRKYLGTDNDINVIFVHGWRADNLNKLGKIFLDSFIDRRYNIYSYILPFHMERSPNSSLYSGEYYVSGNVSRTLKSVQQSVSDIRALISYIKSVKKGKVIIIGLSLGGITSNLLAETEENIDVLISLFYANDLSFTVFQSQAGKYIKKDFLKNNFDESQLNRSWKIINPSLMKPIIDLDKILLVSGKHDKYVLNQDTDKLWVNWGRPLRYKYNCGHSGIVLCKNKINKDVLNFIDKRV
jgi:hypothetical protein